MKNDTTFTIGCDPEFFLRKDDKYIASHPFIHGMKGAPQPIGRGNGVMVDNVAIEFCTQPQKKEKKFLNSIRAAIKGMKAILPNDVSIVAVASAKFPEEELAHPICQEFGCEPDFNAYSGEQNPKPMAELDPTFRSAGAHIHIGSSMLMEEDAKRRFVMLMDALHGLMSIILDDSASSVERRKLYGKAGSYRPKTYGVEYRTLSNFWCKSPDLAKLMYKLTKDAIELFKREEDKKLIEAIGAEKLQKTINTGDKKVALDLIAEHIMDKLNYGTAELFTEAAGKVYSFETSWEK